jgi:S1-C subfamily serine protease
LVLVLINASSLADSKSPRRSGQTLTLEQAISAVAPFVVEMSCDFKHLPEETERLLGAPFFRMPFGTGILVGDGSYVVTAAHVVESMDKLPDGAALTYNTQAYPLGPKQCEVAKFLPNSDAFRSNVTVYGFTRVEVDAPHDIALLKLTETVEVSASHLKFCSKRPRDGEAIAVSGYPLSGKVLVTTSGVIASSWSVEERDVVIPPGFLQHIVAKEVYLADVHVNGGNSGGPVYLKSSGAIVGIVVSFQDAPVVLDDQTPAKLGGHAMFYDSGLAQVVPISYVGALLKKHQVSWEEACSGKH